MINMIPSEMFTLFSHVYVSEATDSMQYRPSIGYQYLHRQCKHSSYITALALATHIRTF